MKKNKAHVVSHAHWDREWRYPIWHHRMWLEKMMTLLVDLLESNNGYECFVMDSQFVSIEDFLAVRPEYEERIKKLVAAERIQIGPWYTLPEQYSIDGESIVRNLLIGRRCCERFGKTMNIAYTTFGWGQPAQMPQIYRNFGIDVALGGKNVVQERTGHNEYIWRGPDGSEMISTKLGVQGRANFFKFFTIPVVFGIENIGDKWKFSMDDTGVIFHFADADRYYYDYWRFFRKETFHPELIKDCIEKVWKTADGTVLSVDRVLFDGGDFSFPQPLLGKMLKMANELSDNIEFKHENLDEYVEVLRKIDTSKLKIVDGELRDAPEQAVTPNALAVRSDIKYLNRQAQNALIRIAEPFSVVNMMLGDGYIENYLNLAWNYLLKSHPHDSINGVAQDKTSRDTLYRLEQVIELSEVVCESSLQNLVKRIRFDKQQDAVALVIFNSLPYPRRETIRLVVDTPVEWHADQLLIEESHGKAVEHDQISSVKTVVPISEQDSRPWPFYIDRHTIDLNTGEVPAMGYKTLIVKTKNKYTPNILWPETRLCSGTLVTQPNGLENEFIKAEINSNGTINITDKVNGSKYTGMHYFEDSGDIGDAWVRYLPVENKVINSITCTAQSWVSHDSELAGAITVEIIMNLPEDCDLVSRKRSEHFKPVHIKSEIILRHGQKFLEIKTVVENTVKSHRLRVMFPTDMENAKFSDAEGHFLVDHRPIAPQRNAEGRYRPAMQTLPQQSFVDVSDDITGLAILNEGLCEYEVLDESHRTVALTLLRAVHQRICTEPRVGAEFPTQNGRQMQGSYEFKYAIYPHKGSWFAGDVYEQSAKLNVPLQVVQTNIHPFGHLEMEKSFLEVEPKSVQVSCIKKAQDAESIVVRLFNPYSKKQKAKLKSAFRIINADLMNFNEDVLQSIPVKNDGEVEIEILPYKVATINLILK